MKSFEWSRCHLPVSFQFPPAAPSWCWTFTRNTEWQSCSSRPPPKLLCISALPPWMENQAASNKVHQITAPTLSGLIRLMVTARDSCHLFTCVSPCHYTTAWCEGFKMWCSTLSIYLKWQLTSEVEKCRYSTQTWLWLALPHKKKKVVLSWKWPFSPSAAEFWAHCSLHNVTNTFFSTGWHAYSVFPPLVPLMPAQQLFTGEAAGSKPMRGFMQIECVRYFDESAPPPSRT